MPFSRSLRDNSSARCASPTETTSGRCRSICPINSSRLAPAANATTPNLSGRASTTDRHCRPIDPVEPKMDSCFKESFNGVRRLAAAFPSSPSAARRPVDLRPWRVDQYPIIPDNRNGKDERVDSVKNAPMTGQNTAGILDPRAALVRRFEKVANLPRHVAHRRHRKQVRQWHEDPAAEDESNQHGSHKTGDSSFPGFLRAKVWCKRMLAYGAAHKISGTITNPGNHQRE